MPAPLLALAVALSAPQDGTITADRITYDQMVGCAATFRLAAAMADVEQQPELVEPALTAAAAYVHLAYLYGRPLQADEAATDAAVETKLAEQISTYGGRLGGPSDRLARQAMRTDQEVCRILSARIAREAEGE